VSEEDDAVLVTARGQSLRFAIKLLRSASRLSGGVRGIKLAPGDVVVGMEVIRPNEAMMVISSQGHGKRTAVEDFPVQGRGGQGVITFKVHDKSGDLVAARMVNADHELILISEKGIVLRTPVAHISLQGRSTQGVRLMDVSKSDAVAAVTLIDLKRTFKESQPLPTGATVDGDQDVKKGKRRPAASKGAKATKPAKATEGPQSPKGPKKGR
jgi:DNA gyrase subunit A